MDSISDPSDWAGTRLPSLSTLDTSLRCRICKDFFTSPLITECAHTFCSLCIRKCLAATPTSTEPSCPICRKSVVEVRLQRNHLIEELAEWFTQSRPSIMEVAKDEPEIHLSRRKRKRRSETEEEEEPGSSRQEQSSGFFRRSTRASRKVAYQEDAAYVSESVNSSDTDADTTSRSSNRAAPAPSSFVNLDSGDESADGLVPCPVCNKRMTEAQTPAKSSSSSIQTLKKNQPLKKDINKHTQRLPKLQYSLLSDAKLRSKMAELGIPTQGTRAQLQSRHAEFVSLWNANQDSASPKSKTMLLKELASWETNLKYSKEKVDSVGDISEWKKKHSSDFQDLVQMARKNIPKKAQARPESHVEFEIPKESVAKADSSLHEAEIEPAETGAFQDNLKVTGGILEAKPAEMQISF